MSAAAIVKTSFLADLKRHLRSPALWVVGLAAPIAAVYMIPPADANYAALTINNTVPRLTPAVLGLQLGVITATLLTPLAYIFLRAGTTKRQPWQVTDITAASKPLMMMGRWAADTVILWVILLALTLAGTILGVFRLESFAYNPLPTAFALWVIAAPALALIAAVRIALDARPWGRRWPGDILFVVFWLAAMIFAIAQAGFAGAETQNVNYFLDPLGFVSPIFAATSDPITGVTIGGAPNTTARLDIDAMRGVTGGEFLFSRLMWVLCALGLAGLAGFIYKPRLARSSGKAVGATRSAAISQAMTLPASLPTQTARAVGATMMAPILSSIQLMLRGRVWKILFVAALLIGAAAPYRDIAGPAIWLALLFPLTAETGRWQSAATRQFLETTGTPLIARAIAAGVGSLTLFAICHIGAIGRAIYTGELSSLGQMMPIIVGVPLVATALGYITRGPVAGRLILLMAWYAYLSSATA